MPRIGQTVSWGGFKDGYEVSYGCCFPDSDEGWSQSDSYPTLEEALKRFEEVRDGEGIYDLYPQNWATLSKSDQVLEEWSNIPPASEGADE